MTDASEQAEPPTRLVRTYAVRRDDDDFEEFVDTVMAQLEGGPTVIDLSRYDRRADVIKLRVIDQAAGGDR